MGLSRLGLIKFARPRPRPLGMQCRGVSHSGCREIAFCDDPTGLHPNLSRQFFQADKRASDVNGTSIPLVFAQTPEQRLQFDSNFAPEADADLDAHGQSLPEDPLPMFGVVHGAKNSNQLIQNVEHRLTFSSWQEQEQMASCKHEESFTTQMTVMFGSATNAAALVLRFAQVACEFATSDCHEFRAFVVAEALRDILGSSTLDPLEVDLIVYSMSGASSEDENTQGTCAATRIIRFLTFKNIWQHLTSGERFLIASSSRGLLSDKLMADGLADGIEAFSILWHNLAHEQHKAAKANLQSYHTDLCQSTLLSSLAIRDQFVSLQSE